jgi:hypothetical protein
LNLLVKERSRLAVRTKTECELFVLKIEHLEEVIAIFPQFEETIQLLILESAKKHGSVSSESGNAPTCHCLEKTALFVNDNEDKYFVCQKALCPFLQSQDAYETSMSYRSYTRRFDDVKANYGDADAVDSDVGDQAFANAEMFSDNRTHLATAITSLQRRVAAMESTDLLDGARCRCECECGGAHEPRQTADMVAPTAAAFVDTLLGSTTYLGNNKGARLTASAEKAADDKYTA